MDLRDATLMLLAESGAHPDLVRIAQSAYDDLSHGTDVSYEVLNDLLGEASGKGVLGALRQKYSPAAYEAILEPICREIGRQAPVPPYRGPLGEP
jgi:hypothetical protein